MKSEDDYPVALWVERQKGTDMISRVYKIHRTSVAMSFNLILQKISSPKMYTFIDITPIRRTLKNLWHRKYLEVESLFCG